MALNLAPFGRWTLRDKAAQRRLALTWTPTFAKLSIADFEKVKIAAIHPDSDRSSLLLSLMESAERGLYHVTELDARRANRTIPLTV